MVRRILAGMAAGATAVLALATPAQADDAKLSASAQTECGKVTVTFVNNTANLYSADIRVDDEPGVDDQFTSLGNITGGPNDGKPYGQRYQKVTIPAGETVTKDVTFAEDSGKHKVAYRIWRGPETDYYVDWQTAADVESDCKPNTQPPSAKAKKCEAYVYTGTKQNLCAAGLPEDGKVNCDDVKYRVTLVDAANDPWGLDGDRGKKGVGCESNPLRPASGTGGGSSQTQQQQAASLPVTGVPARTIGIAAGVLLVAGVVLVVATRRRRTTV